MSEQRRDTGSFAYGPASADFEQRVDFSKLRADRLMRVQQRLLESELHALLVFKDENVRFLTGLRAQLLAGKSAQLNGVLLVAGQEPIVLVSGGDLERSRESMPWISEWHQIPILEARGLIRGVVAQTVRPLLERFDLEAGVLGIDECSYALVLELMDALPRLRIDDGDALMQSARRAKSPAELAVMQEASAIAEGVTAAAIAAVSPGVRENEVAGEAMRALYHLGGELSHVTTPFVGSGEHMTPPHRLATDKVIRNGDLVFIDIGAMWNGYFSDLGRTVVCGTPNADQRRVFAAVHAALMAGTAEMRPGNSNDDVARAITDVAREHGLADHFIPLFIGHGVGMGANEPPYVGETLPGAEVTVLEAGMTLALEPLIWLPNASRAGVRLEDTIVVSEGGGTALTRTEFDERLL